MQLNFLPINDYAQLINDAIKNQHQIPCSFSARGKTPIRRKNSTICASFRGVCGGSRYRKNNENVCKTTFKCRVRNFDKDATQVTIDVDIGGEFQLFQENSTGRQCRGETRAQLQQEMKHKTALNHHLSEYSKLSNVSFLHKNLPTRSVDVARNLRSQGNLVGSRRGVDAVIAIRDVEASFKANSRFQENRFPDLAGYVKGNVDTPHKITLLYAPSQLRFAKGCDILYFDATGNIVHPENIGDTEERKQVLLHSAVAKLNLCPNTPAVPIMDVTAVAGFLLQFVSDVRKYKSNWQPQLFVVDMCLAS